MTDLNTMLPMAVSVPPPVAVDDEVCLFPTSWAQRRMWFLDRFEPGSPYYNIPLALRLRGAIDRTVLRRAFNEIVRRHESLRTTFASEDGEPIQLIAPLLRIDLPLIDLPLIDQYDEGEANRGSGEAEVLRLAREEARRPFDLARGPLLRVKLVRLAPEDHVLLLTMHHIVSDGWSMGVLVREMVALHRAFSRGEPSPLPELPIQYADYACWQRERLDGAELERQAAWWRERLSGELPVLNLPTDRPRPTLQSSNGSSISLTIPPALTRKITEFARTEGATLFMTLLAGFKVLLARYSGQSDIIVGSPIANRQRAEIEDLIGCFINTLALRTDLSGDPDFREIVRRVREVTLGAFEHQDLPFEMLVEDLQPVRDLSRSPLFQVMFILQNAPTRSGEIAGLRVSQMEVDSGVATCDLTLSVAETAAGLDLAVEYNTDLFEQTTIERLIRHYRNLLEVAVDDPARPVAELRLLDAEERERILVEWNRTEVSFPVSSGSEDIVGLFERHAAMEPHSVAVVDGSARLSYGELNERVNRLAHHLRRLGAGPEKAIGVSLDRSAEMIVAILAVLKSGAAYVPLDPLAPADRIGFIIDESRMALLISDTATAERLPTAGVRLVLLDSDRERIARQSGRNLKPMAGPGSLAYVLYTSGTTGRPKGVMIERGSLLNAWHAWAHAWHLDQVRSHLQMASFTFDVFSGDLVRALCSGATLVLCPREYLLDPPRLLELLVAERIECAEFVPAVLRLLVDHLEATGHRLDAMKLLLCGSDTLYVGEFRRFRRFCGEGTRLINSFGLTEATIDNSFCDEVPPGLGADEFMPIGKPIANTRMYVLDSRRQPQPIGVPGELYVGGAGLARGYLGSPELTAERFIEWSPDGDTGRPMRLYRTGDLARYLADGNLQFLGRTDHQIKIRGLRIEPGEIEAVLRQSPAVREAVVGVSPDPRGVDSLVAWLVPGEGLEPSPAQLRRLLLERLPGYMVPAAFVPISRLPLSSNGKIDRQALPLPDWSRRDPEAERVPPRTAREKSLVRIWQEVLRIEQIGVEDNFFELGGHSLLATQVVSRVRDAFGIDLPLRNVFEFPTVAGLATSLESLRANGGEDIGTPTEEPIIAVARDGELPLSFAQQRLWFLHQLEPESAGYNIPEALRLRGLLDVEVLRRCLEEVIRRHESLRTTFAEVDGQPRQQIGEPKRVDLPVTDLCHLPAADREREASRLAAADARQPFDLARGPLLRASLVKLGDDDHVLTMAMHHIVTDDWSSNLLFGEIVTLYDAFSHNRPSPLPQLTIQYADFACWQRHRLQGDHLEREIDWWREQLSGSPELLELPTDRPRPPVQSFSGAAVAFDLPERLAKRVADYAREAGATPYMVLLAAFQALLGRYTGQELINVGTPIANRNRSQLEGIVGFFVNTLVMRGDLRGEPSFRELVRRTREAALGAYAHQDLPFETLVDALRPTRDPGHSPIFQTMFVLQNAPQRARRLADSGLTIEPFESHSGTAKFDLTLFMTEEGERLGGAFEFNTDLFDQPTIRRMADHFVNLLSGLLDSPEASVARVNYLSEQELALLIDQWARNEVSFPGQEPFHRLFEEVVGRQPEVVAVSFEGATLSYRELNERANRLANYLRRQGIGPESIVAISVERSFEAIVGLLAIMKAGGAYLPLDPRYPLERLGFMLNDSQASLLLTTEALAGRLSSDGARIVSFEAAAAETDRESGENPDGGAELGHLAYVIYTSGSTGRPKGVMIEHRGLRNLTHLLRQRFGLTAADRVLQFSPLSFDASIWEVALTLGSGAQLVMATQERLTSLDELHQLLREEKITTALMPAAVLRLLEPTGLDHLSTVMTAGERCTRDIVERWQPGRIFINAYGPTEATVGVTVEECLPASEDPPIGRPLPNVEAYVMDRHGQPVPIGVAGELWLGGECLARGYLHRPEVTREKFVAHPFRPAAGALLYRTGDQVRYRPDGRLEYLGRIDDQVKIRGYRIELEEIDAALRECEGVSDAAVAVFDDGRGGKRLAGYFIPDGDQPAAMTASLRRQLRERLPDYMVPAICLPLDRLPLTPSGKVDRRALPLPGPDRPDLVSVYVPPSGEAEEGLAAIWSELLGVERIGSDDDFFELGGHSLLATQAASRIRAAFGVDFPVRQIFEHPILSAQAVAVQAARLSSPGDRGAEPPMARVARDGSGLPLSFAQQRLWFLHQLDPQSPAYNIPLAFHARGELRIDRLSAAISALIARHEALRTTFAPHPTSGDGQPLQLIGEAWSFELPLIDLTTLPPDEQQQEATRQAAEEARRPFDLERGPLLRGRVVRLGQDDHLILLTMHHIIGDEWSVRILFDELAKLYDSPESLATLPELPYQYADYAAWQRQWLRGEVLGRQLDYWKRQLADVPETLDLVTDRTRPPVQTFAGAAQPFDLPESLASRLREFSRTEGVTLFTPLLAAFQALLSRYSSQDLFAVGTPIANRHRLETEGIVGIFINTAAIRADLRDDPTFRDLTRRVREAVLGAQTHQDLPFEMVVDALHRERDTARTPLFQVLFVMQNAVSEPRELRSAGMLLSPFETPSVAAKFDLTLFVSEDGGRIGGAIEYNTDLFEASTIMRMVRHFRTLLAAMLASPESRISLAPMLDDAERRRLLFDWNRTLADYPIDRRVDQLFTEQVARTPGAPAVFDGGESLTFSELDQRANRLAWKLHRLGAEPDQPIALYAERSSAAIVGLMGILKSGAPYLPLDPSYPAERISFILGDAAPRAIVAPRSLLPRLGELAAGLEIIDPDSDEAVSESLGAPPAAAKPENLAYILYTSGSTGRPKGVMIEHRSVVNLAEGLKREVYDAVFGPQPPRGLRVSLNAPLMFDASVKQWLTLLFGHALFVLPAEARLDGQSLLGYLRQHQLDVLDCVPTQLRLLIDAGLADESAWRPSLVLSGGEAIDTDLWRRLSSMERPRFYNLYGPTECTVDSTACAISPEVDRPTIGRPLPNTGVYIIDRHGRLAPTGLPGELCIGGAGLARGYLNRPEMTAERFIVPKFDDAAGAVAGGKTTLPLPARLYRSGDLARWLDDGRVEYLGRVDRQIKLRGQRIEPGEIEALLRLHAQVREAAVDLRLDAHGEQFLAAFVVSAEGTSASATELRGHLRGHLPEYMIPTAFVPVDGLPLLPNGKLDRRALPLETGAERGDQQRLVPPRDLTEAQLTAIWEEVLGHSPIGVTDNFFDLGGHSLLAVRVIALIRQRHGFEIPLVGLLEEPTIEHLATLIREGGQLASRSPLVRLQPGNPTRDPLFILHPSGGSVHWYAGLARQLGEDQPVYGLQAIGLDGAEPPQQSVEEMAATYIEAMLRLGQELGRGSGRRINWQIAGWSMGVVFAYEVARQLAAAGERVSLLAMLDQGPTHRRVDPTSAGEFLCHAFERHLPIDRQRLDEISDPEAQIRYVFELGRTERWINTDVTEEQFRHFVALLRAQSLACQHYDFEGHAPFPGRIDLFRATEQPEENGVIGGGGWELLAPGRVSIHDVPGDHISMLMEEPGLSVLARHLRGLLDQSTDGRDS